MAYPFVVFLIRKPVTCSLSLALVIATNSRRLSSSFIDVFLLKLLAIPSGVKNTTPHSSPLDECAVISFTPGYSPSLLYSSANPNLSKS